MSDILYLNVNAQRLQWSSIEKKFTTKFLLSTKTWKKIFIEYGFPVLAAISADIGWGKKCACGERMRKSHYKLNPGYNTWKTCFLGKDLLLAMQGMTMLSLKEIVIIIEDCKKLLNPQPKEHKIDEQGFKNLREKPF